MLFLWSDHEHHNRPQLLPPPLPLIILTMTISKYRKINRRYIPVFLHTCQNNTSKNDSRKIHNTCNVTPTTNSDWYEDDRQVSNMKLIICIHTLCCGGRSASTFHQIPLPMLGHDVLTLNVAAAKISVPWPWWPWMAIIFNPCAITSLLHLGFSPLFGEEW